MLPAVIDYLLGTDAYQGWGNIYPRTYQMIFPNFPPVQTIMYTISPPAEVHSYILYQWVFGEAMMPHAFDAKFEQSGNRIFDAIISGYFTTNPIQVFAFVTTARPIDMSITNLRLLPNYYELTTFYLSVPTVSVYDAIKDALRRMQTSTRLEELSKQATDLLKVISEKPPGPRAPIGGA